jgi:predicted nuclease of predicted toxin-antitoxin system
MRIPIWNRRMSTKHCTMRHGSRRRRCTHWTSPPVKFLVDMGIAPKTVAFLQALAHAAVHLSNQDLERLPNRDIVEKARQEGRILLVHDLGFGELVAASGATFPSVITFRLRNMHPDRHNGALQRIIPQHREALECGGIISLTEARVRVRFLPLGS